MGVPQVVIVGRPNVGKSSLFNWLVHKRIAIVDDRAGVTRDRITFLMEEGGRFFELVDTGGIGFDDEDDLTQYVEAQIDTAIESAAVILFVVDTRDGMTPLDQEVARRLRITNAPVILVANKTDAMSLENLTAEFHELNYQPLMSTSVHQNRGREELLEKVVSLLPTDTGEAPPTDAVMKIAIVGRRNVGKSTFVNTLAQAERMIVSEVPGTTRDSIDVRFELDGKTFIAIDTPGLKRTKAIANDMEFYSFHRAQRSIRRADVVLIFYDCSDPIAKPDKQLADYVAENYKPCIFVVNKWDLYAGKVSTDEWVKYIHDTFRSMKYVPIAFITGQTGKNMKALLNHAQMLFKQSTGRIGTGELNRLLRWALAKNAPAVYQNRRPKIFYATQVGIQPPTIVLFCSEPLAITADYKRYLLSTFRDHLPFSEVPVKLYLRASHGDPKRDAARGGRAAPRPDEGSQEKSTAIPFDTEADGDDFEDGFDEKDLLEADAASRGEGGTFDAEWSGLDPDEE